MKFYHRLSLSHQIRLLFAIAVGMTLSISLGFYQVTFESLRSREEQYMYDMMAQVAQKTEDFIASADCLAEAAADASSAVHLLRETNKTKKWRYRQSLNRLFSDIVKSNSSVTNIVLLDNSGKVCGFNGPDYSLVNRLDSLYSLFSPDNCADGFITPLYAGDTDIPYYANIRTVYDTGTYKDRKLGFCIIIGTCGPLYEACRNTSSMGSSLFMILNDKGEVIVRSQETDAAAETDIIHSLRSRREALFSAEIDGKKYLLSQYAPLPSTGWQIASAVSYREFDSGLREFRNLALLSVFLLLGIYLLLGHMTVSSITAPLNRIIHFIKKGPDYTLRNHVEIAEKNELGYLADQINLMLDQISELTDAALRNQTRMYAIELAHHQARLSALQSQINPHFLYNTLDAIQGLTYLGRIEDIRTAVSSLSTIMRYSIKGEDMVRVRSEILCIRKYLQIIDIRFVNRFTFHISVPDGIMDYEMPRFLLQPLVENAIFHGLEPKTGKGTLSLSSELRGNSVIHFRCADDGIGIAPEELNRLRGRLLDAPEIPNPSLAEKYDGIGLTNIHLRLRLLYGSPYGLSIESAPGQGTVICVDFPTAAPEIIIQRER